MVLQSISAAQDPAGFALLERVHRVHDLGKALSVLSWDREVNMPPGGDRARVQQMTTLRQLLHQEATGEAYGEAIESAAAAWAGLPDDDDRSCLIRVLRRDYARSRKLPEAFVLTLSRESAQAWTVWKQAREEDAFPLFRPHLERLVELQREMAELYGYETERYDALLDGYEEGARAAEIRAVFATVKAATVPLLEAIVASGRAVDDALLHQAYPVAAQETFARQIAAEVGYDFRRGHLGTAVHPFASSFDRGDARITTRWYPAFLSPSLFGTLHECGHAIYEQGTAEALARTPLARGCSSGIHESQSRMLENVVGRSRAFWRRHFPALQASFPAQLSGATAEDFYRAVNKVQASLIRVEADELTYNLHIILRFELEQALLSGDLAVADLPTAWNDGLHRLLGIHPPNDREGCLQDVHWSGTSFGYFPTYALGNLYAAQLRQAALAADAGIGVALDAGDWTPLLQWLGREVHLPGRKFPPSELIRRATGKALDAADFVAYVRAKFSDLYGLG